MSISVSAFERATGLPNGYISKIKKNIGQDKLVDILKAYPQLRSQWLHYGEGEMLQNPHAERVLQLNIVPLLPSLSLGMPIDEFLGAHSGESERVVSPIEGGDFALKMACDSMATEYPVGSIIVAKRVDVELFIEWGKVYVIDTLNGLVIRRLMPTESPEELRCESNNESYPPMNMPLRDIRGLYRVLLLMITK